VLQVRQQGEGCELEPEQPSLGCCSPRPSSPRRNPTAPGTALNGAPRELADLAHEVLVRYLLGNGRQAVRGAEDSRGQTGEVKNECRCQAESGVARVTRGRGRRGRRRGFRAKIVHRVGNHTNGKQRGVLRHHTQAYRDWKRRIRYIVGTLAKGRWTNTQTHKYSKSNLSRQNNQGDARTERR